MLLGKNPDALVSSESEEERKDTVGSMPKNDLVKDEDHHRRIASMQQ